MFWVDEIIAEVERRWPGRKSFIVRDEKTASGRVHVGSLRGVVIHAIVTQALIEKGFSAEFFFEINDADPMDGLPLNLSQKFKPFMGRPLKDVPPPDTHGEPDIAAFETNPRNNFARFYGEEFIAVIRKLGCAPTFYYASEKYEAGEFDSWIDTVLKYPAEIRKVYKDISGSEKGEEWNPLQIVCEKCGKVGTTTVVASTGEPGKKIVEYTCEPHKVKWAVGCDYKGKVSPYLGRGKLPWKVEWGVKWNMFPVDIEGSGKDHQAASGSHDVASGIVEKVLTKDVPSAAVPLNIPYEHFLFGGAKMSASKGIGASAKEVADTLPPVLLRFLMVRTRPEKAIDFDPGGNTLPRLYDFFDEAAAVSFGRKTSDVAEDVKRAFHFSQLVTGSENDFFRPRFSRAAFFVQMPQLDFLEEVAKLKGAALTPQEIKEAKNRADYAKKWLKDYAPENDKFEVQKKLPEQAASLTADQKKFLHEIAILLEQKNWKGEELHAQIHELRKKSPLTALQGFQAIYLALLGKTSGPQAGWFLEALPKEFVVKRFREV